MSLRFLQPKRLSPQVKKKPKWSVERQSGSKNVFPTPFRFFFAVCFEPFFEKLVFENGILMLRTPKREPETAVAVRRGGIFARYRLSLR
jgi:hypothetical protein